MRGWTAAALEGSTLRAPLWESCEDQRGIEDEVAFSTGLLMPAPQLALPLV